jgi:RNA polymerase sigma-70 factor (ECF subfamily)
MMHNADSALVQQVLIGRRECYRPLVEKYKKKVFVLACSMIGNAAEAQDVSQEVFYIAFKNLHGLKDRHKFGSWLYGITRNLCYSVLRKQRVEPESLEELNYFELPNVVEMRPADKSGEDLTDKLLHQLEKLPEKYRILLRLKYLEDYSYQEISEMLDLPVDLIRSRLFEGRRMLRENIEQTRRIENAH